MRVAPLAVLVVAVGLVAGCGGSDTQTVNGCVIEPSTPCANLDLSGADLEGADLSRADLSGTNLEGTNLSGANLSEANLTRAQIVDADLSEADLTSANLTGATITGTDLSGAVLCGTIRTDGTTDDSNCPASTETTVSEAEITVFQLSELECGAATTGPVTVTWETENATAVEIAVDAVSPIGYPASGTATVVVACDGAQHTVTITPQSDAGPGAPETKLVSTGS